MHMQLKLEQTTDRDWLLTHQTYTKVKTQSNICLTTLTIKYCRIFSVLSDNPKIFIE